MSINPNRILRISLTQCPVVVFEPETTDHYLLLFKLYTDLRLDLLNNMYTINQFLKNFSEEQLVNVLPFDSENFTLDTNANIRCTIEFLKVTECFNSLFFEEQTDFF